jgi:thiol-disulfide isomerase/thioredoxin
MMTFSKILALSTVLAIVASPFAVAEAGKKGDKPDKIAHGEQIELKDYLVPGKITVFDFTSQYCPPCRQISPLLDELHARRDDVAVVKIDINRPDTKGIDWKSPVAQQYQLQSIPHFKVYDASGKLMAEGDAGFEMVAGWIEQK